MKLSGWGRYPVVEAKVQTPADEASLRAVVRSASQMIARGNGRSYGDSAVNPSLTLDMRRFNRLVSFNAATGQLIAEAGVPLADIINIFLPRGWFPWVTPGTKFVTLGGAIAADVHGKNHHKHGSFRSCVDWIDLMASDGTVHRCSPSENPELFHRTLGGMGLTGIILRAAIRLRPVETGWIRQTIHPAPNLAAAIDLCERSGDATYSVAWIDCLGRGSNLGRSLVMLGEHAGVDELPVAQRQSPYLIPRKRTREIPCDFPAFCLNAHTVRAFNTLYYRAGTRNSGTQLVSWDEYFYPLDAMLGWNRIYGRKGFVQFQCVLPLTESAAGLSELLLAISNAGLGSFLAVLKRLGAQDSPFSFPMEGYTLALDFPVNTRTLALLEQLDQITIKHGGRQYLAKDARMTAATLRASDARAAHYHKWRQEHALSQVFISAQSTRLEL